jgi:AraC-like DNA-binding protein
MALRTPITIRGLPVGVLAGRFLSQGRELRHIDRVQPDYELILVGRGRLPLVEDGVALDPAAGCAVVLRPGLRHHGPAPYATDLEFLWLHFTLPARGTAILRLPSVCRPPCFARAYATVRRYLDAQEAGELDPATAGALILLALADVARADAPVREAGNPLVARADEEIARHFPEPRLTTADIARTLGCNPDHLGRAYRQARGRTVLEAITHRRIADAERLLQDGGRSQADIAKQCGFDGLCWFRRVFRRRTGMTPGAWQRMYARGSINTR